MKTVPFLRIQDCRVGGSVRASQLPKLPPVSFTQTRIVLRIFLCDCFSSFLVIHCHQEHVGQPGCTPAERQRFHRLFGHPSLVESIIRIDQLINHYFFLVFQIVLTFLSFIHLTIRSMPIAIFVPDLRMKHHQ